MNTTTVRQLAVRDLPAPLQLALWCLAVLFAFAASANAQNVTVLNVPTITSLWAGTTGFATAGLSSVTFPASGLILPGTAISKFTGKPERHLWYGDSSNGFCRVDPEIDDPNLAQPSPGIGRFNNIITTVTPISPQGADIAITMSSPATVNAGAFVTFSMTITNNGPGDAALVTLTDSLPAVFQASTTSQGVCTHTGTSFSCNLGSMLAGAHATVSVTVIAGNTAITNTAAVQLRDALGNLIADTTVGNNLASSITNITAPPPPVGGVGGGTGGGSVSADIQVKGSASNGGPNQGTGDTFTWQIKNSTGNTSAPNVVFTLPLPASFQFVSAAGSQGTCGGVAPGLFGGTLTCNLASLPGGQTLLVTVNFVPLQAGTFSTTGSATFGGTDTNISNNSFTVTIRPR